VRRDDAAVRQEFPRVVEDDDAVAQQAPSLLGMGGDGVRGVPVDGVGRWTVRSVVAHGVSPETWPRTRIRGIKVICRVRAAGALAATAGSGGRPPSKGDRRGGYGRYSKVTV
jgi:hypothetical protein